PVTRASRLFPYTTLFRSRRGADRRLRSRGEPALLGAARTTARAMGSVLEPPARRCTHEADAARDRPFPAGAASVRPDRRLGERQDRKSTRLNSSHVPISY